MGQDKLMTYNKSIELKTLLNIYSGTGLTISSTDIYDKYISAHTASTGLQEFTLPALAANLGKRYSFQNQGLGLTYLNSAEGGNMFFKEYILDKMIMVKSGDKCTFLATATGWLVEDYEMCIESGWYNRSDYTTVNIGFSNFDYDTKSGGTGDMTGEKYILASGNTGLILKDNNPTGASGTFIVCFLTGDGLAFNNEIGTCGSSQTFAVNETGGSNKNQDWDIYHNMDININSIDYIWYFNSSASYTGAYKGQQEATGQESVYLNVLGCAQWKEIDVKNLRISTADTGFSLLTSAGSNRQTVGGLDWFVNIILKITT